MAEVVAEVVADMAEESVEVVEEVVVVLSGLFNTAIVPDVETSSTAASHAVVGDGCLRYEGIDPRA